MECDLVVGNCTQRQFTGAAARALLYVLANTNIKKKKKSEPLSVGG